MRIAPLKVNKKPEYTLNKPADILPLAENVSPFFVQIASASRGYGKTYSICQLVNHLAKSRFYNRFIICSPTYESDLKQASTYEDIANMGHQVERYPELNEEIMEKIMDDCKDWIEIWREYKKKLDIWNILKKKGQKALTDEQMIMLFSNFLDNDDDINDISFDDIFDEYPDWIRREQPPCSHLFLDDCYAERLLSKTRNNPLIKAVVNGRHMLLSMTFATQSIASIPRAIRSNTQIWSIWATKSKKDLDCLLLEVENCFPSIDHFYKAMDMASKEDYGFLLIDGASIKTPIISIGYNNRITFENNFDVKLYDER